MKSRKALGETAKITKTTKIAKNETKSDEEMKLTLVRSPQLVIRVCVQHVYCKAVMYMG